MATIFGQYSSILSETIVGSNGDDTIDHKSGSDTVDGGAGADTVLFNDSQSHFRVMTLAGITRVVPLSNASQEYAGEEVLLMNVENIRFSDGTASVPTVLSGSPVFGRYTSFVSETIVGSSSNDTIEHKSGPDTIDGGAGVDTVLFYDNQSHFRVMTLAGITRVIPLSNASQEYAGEEVVLMNVEKILFLDGIVSVSTTLSGSPMFGRYISFVGETIVGSSSDDTIDHKSGPDTIDGGAGIDTVLFYDDQSHYKVMSLDGITRVIPLSNASQEYAGEEVVLMNVENILFLDGTVSVPTALSGSPMFGRYTSFLGETIVGSSSNDTIDHKSGPDTIDGGAGNDSVLFYDSKSNYTVTIVAGTTRVVPLSSATAEYAGETVTLTNVERIMFLVGVVTLGQAEDVPSGGSQDPVVTQPSTPFFGGTGNDVVFGSAGNDQLDGGPGTDTMLGGAGDDIYIVDRLSDKVVENDGGGTDTISTPLAAFGLGASPFRYVENLTYTGQGAFSGTGNGLANVISGGLGNDTLNGGRGDDTLVGGGGNDRLIGGDVAGQTGVDTVVLAGNTTDYTFGRLTSAAINQSIIVTHNQTAEADVLVGIERVVFLNTPLGRFLTDDDLLRNIGSSSRDTYTDDDAANTWTSFTGLAGDDVASGGGRENRLDGGAGNDTLRGGGGNDVLIGGAGNDVLSGDTGDDSMSGGAGNDRYVVDAVGDRVVELPGGGADSIDTSLNTFTLVDNVEKLVFIGTGDFTGVGTVRNDRIVAGSGNDHLDGGAGIDRLEGGQGDDTYVIDRMANPAAGVAGDIVVDAAGADTIETALSTFSLGGYGAVENLRYTGVADFSGTGNALGNALVGGGGNDRLAGGGGDDTLTGGIGADTYTGGTGFDVFVFDADPATGVDVIRDFGLGDRIQLGLAHFDKAGSPGTLASESFVNGVAAQDANDFIIYDRATGLLWYDADGSGDGLAVQVAVIANKAALSASNFLLA